MPLLDDQVCRWASELQSLAQAGLFYGKDVYDRERYQRIREISAEMMALKTGLSTETVKDLFCSDSGYQTPKIDTRASIIEENKILLVRENNGLWSMPGGWCDFNLSPMENTVKEVKEEAGLDVRVDSVIAVQDRAKHNEPPYAYGIVKIFYSCTVLGGCFAANSETTRSGWFSLESLPPLSTEKCTAEQIRMCFESWGNTDWRVQFD